MAIRTFILCSLKLLLHNSISEDEGATQIFLTLRIIDSPRETLSCLCESSTIYSKFFKFYYLFFIHESLHHILLKSNTNSKTANAPPHLGPCALPSVSSLRLLLASPVFPWLTLFREQASISWHQINRLWIKRVNSNMAEPLLMTYTITTTTITAHIACQLLPVPNHQLNLPENPGYLLPIRTVWNTPSIQVQTE